MMIRMRAMSIALLLAAGVPTAAWADFASFARRLSNDFSLKWTAAAMGYSRIVLGAHWLSDVAVGALLGYGCASQVISAHDNRAPGDDNEWHLDVDFSGGRRGVAFSRRF